MQKIKILLLFGLSFIVLLLTASSCGGAPEIVDFTADPETITSGETSTLSWTVRNATSLSINQGVGDVTGQTSVTVSPTETTTYTLTATNSMGSVTRTVTVTVEESGEEELSRAIREVLPDMEAFQLVRIDDAPIVATLEAAIGSPDPVYVNLPIVDPDNTLTMHQWTAYHVNVRSPEFIAEFNTEELEAAPIQGPSRTFQGLPNWSDNAFFAELTRLQREQPNPEELDESLYQASVLNIIGDHLEGAYYGNPQRPYASVLEHVETLLEPHVGMAEAERLAGLTENNYIVYNHDNYQPEVVHDENEATLPEDEVQIDGFEQVQAAATLEPQNHVNVRVLRPVMVADATIYNPDTNTWLVSNWHARMDAAANRQNAYLWLAHIGPNLPASYSTTPNNNSLIIRTQIGGYLRLTQYGKTLLNPANNTHYPNNSCGGAGSFVDNVRRLSNNYTNHSNEYWMWWTRHYGGGCAYISTLGRTPRNGAVGWSGWGNATVDWTSFVFMHESGHILGGLHSIDNTGNTGETWNSHRCRLLGIWPFGPTGPSVMSYAGGTRTYCYAITNANHPTTAFRSKKNVTYMADYLHPRLQ